MFVLRHPYCLLCTVRKVKRHFSSYHHWKSQPSLSLVPDAAPRNPSPKHLHNALLDQSRKLGPCTLGVPWFERSLLSPANFDALLSAAEKRGMNIGPKDNAELSALCVEANQAVCAKKFYLRGWGSWRQPFNFSLDFAALVNYWIDRAAHSWLTALLALGKRNQGRCAARVMNEKWGCAATTIIITANWSGKGTLKWALWTGPSAQELRET